MFCPKCGAKNTDDSKFCQECGAGLDSPATGMGAPSTVAAVSKADVPPTPAAAPTGAAPVATAPVAAAPAGAGVAAAAAKQAGSSKKIIGLVVAIVVVIAVIAAVVALCSGGPKEATYRISANNSTPVSVTFEQNGDHLSIVKGPVALRLDKVGAQDGGTVYELPLQDITDIMSVSGSGSVAGVNPSTVNSVKVLVPDGLMNGDLNGVWRATIISNGSPVTLWADVQNGVATGGATETDGFSGAFNTQGSNYQGTLSCIEQNGRYTIAPNGSSSAVIVEYVK